MILLAIVLVVILVGAVTFDMLRSSLSQSSAMRTLRNRTAFFVNMDKRSVYATNQRISSPSCQEHTRVVAGTDTMSPDTSITSVFLPFDQHLDRNIYRARC